MLSSVDLIAHQVDTHNKLNQALSVHVSDQKDLRDAQNNIEGLKQVAGEFESIFIHMLLKSMRQTVNRGEGMLPVSTGQEIWEDMLDQEVSKEMGETRGFGIADAIINAYQGNLEKYSGQFNVKG